ncbi:MAG TPA: GH116 family glycosyl-hydrolase [Armatimonadota bacterium]|nr:GH116 family glycosyl-hydrolase [Armatimonadota bacterium]
MNQEPPDAITPFPFREAAGREGREARNAASGSCGAGEPCLCRPMPRRTFLALSGLSLAAAALDAMPVMAGPFEAADFARLIPPIKKLRPAWVHSLYAPGESTVYSKKRGELRYIGMPVGGICAGSLYLGGDGKLWLWDIFNQNQLGILPRSVPWSGFGQERTVDAVGGASYLAPHEPQSPLEQGFALKIGGVVRPVSAGGWEEVTFTGEYPLGVVDYSDPASPVAVTLTAYSPFIPLNADDSSLPVTICEFTVRNVSDRPVDAEMAGWLQNACSLFSAQPGSGVRVNSVRKTAGVDTGRTTEDGGRRTGYRWTSVFSRFEPTPPPEPSAVRPDLVVDDFEHPTYGGWKVEGTAFGAGPVEKTAIPAYQGDVGGEGLRVVNSHASAPGGSVQEKDSRTGKLTSPPFQIQRRFLTFYIGGGSNVEQVGMRLIVDGKIVRRAAGHDSNQMQPAAFDVGYLAGKTAVIEIYDNGTGGWGNIGVDDIVQTDTSHLIPPMEEERDFGTMAIAVIGAGVSRADSAPDAVFDAPVTGEARTSVGERLIGSVTKKIRLAPGKSQTISFVVAWHFSNSGLDVPDAKTGNEYARRFKDAAAVIDYVVREFPRLSRDTKLWHTTWYDSTLPHWFLDRTFANTSILATSTAHRFGTGRFWGWEGIGCCFGTCTHVWHYAQAVGRVFPELERYTREHVDFGVSFDAKTGMIGYRGEGTGPAVDGQAGRILGAYREHQMSADDAFLRRIWPRVREAMEFLIHHDSNGDGLLDGAQENTLDAAWYGKIAWLSSLYAAALRASEEMAKDAGDEAFARLCHQKFLQSKDAIETQLYTGEYFIQKPAPDHEKSIGAYQTCHIDQVHGQSWAWQVGLGRTLDREKTLSALRALYKYNFAPDVGPFREKNPPGRAYALAGDAGLIMATNPRDLPDAFGDAAAWQYGYFNECMTGFEHQAASHMIAEGLIEEGLAVTRAIHDRYHASRRNPFNEIECSDHYSRAMASYGSFISACGFTYHGPKGHLGFAPRLNPDDFRAAFTTAEGWGTFSQKRSGRSLKASLLIRHGRLRLNNLALTGTYHHVTARMNGKAIPASVAMEEERPVVTLGQGVVMETGGRLVVSLG